MYTYIDTYFLHVRIDVCVYSCVSAHAGEAASERKRESKSEKVCKYEHKYKKYARQA